MQLAGALMEHSSPPSSSYFASRSLDVEMDSEASLFLVVVLIQEVTWGDRYLFTVEFWERRDAVFICFNMLMIFLYVYIHIPIYVHIQYLYMCLKNSRTKTVHISYISPQEKHANDTLHHLHQT